jgi:membrane protein implicated in regulation of membrane protease activity
MQPFPQGHGRSLRVASVLLALLVLLALVAFASRTGFGHASSTTTTPGYVNWATSIFLVAFFVLAPISVWAYVHQARERLERQQHKSFQARVIRGLIFIPILALAYFARLYLRDKIHLSSGFHQLFFGHHLAAGQGKNDKAAAPYSPTFQWPVLWAAIVILLAALAAWVWWRRKHPPVTRLGLAARTLEDEVAGSLNDAIDDLESEPDARRAVIAAYARMEGVFGRHGLRRHASETATEYLQRILLGLTTRVEAVGRLTGLFEQAKFSDHPIDGRMKQDAIDALRVIRDDLQMAEA